MINYKLLKDNGIVPKSVSKINNSYLVDTGSDKYILKKRNDSLDDKFSYLLSRGFDYFPSHTSIGNYDVFDYIDGGSLSLEESLDEICSLTGLLHAKTTRYKNIDIDDYKIIYEDLLKDIEYLNNYYNELNDMIDNEIYMSPSNYLLVFNISKIYSALSFCMNLLEEWYDLIKNSSKQRLVFIHNNLDVSHVISGTSPYLISFNYSKVGMPIEDLVKLYNKYYNKIDFSTWLNNYQKRYPLREDELKLFFIKISIPDKIEFDFDEFENTKNVKLVLDKIYTGDKLIRPFFEKK